jgi:hypothetical protein
MLQPNAGRRLERHGAVGFDKAAGFLHKHPGQLV